MSRRRQENPLQRLIDFTPSGLASTRSEEIAAIALSIRRRRRLPASDDPDLFQHGFAAAIMAGHRYIDGRVNTSCYWSYASKRVRFAISDFATCRHGEVQRRAARATVAAGAGQVFMPIVGDIEAPADDHGERIEAIKHLLKELMGTLTSREFLLIRMRYIDQMGLKEIAKVLGIKYNSTRVMISEALARLRQNAAERGINKSELAAVIN